MGGGGGVGKSGRRGGRASGSYLRLHAPALIRLLRSCRATVRMAVHFRSGCLVRDGSGHTRHGERKRGIDPAPLLVHGLVAQHVRPRRAPGGGGEFGPAIDSGRPRGGDRDQRGLCAQRARTWLPPARKAAIAVHHEPRTRRGKAAEVRRGPDGNRRFHHELAVIRARQRRPARNGGGRRCGGDRGAWRGTRRTGREVRNRGDAAARPRCARCSWTTHRRGRVHNGRWPLRRFPVHISVANPSSRPAAWQQPEQDAAARSRAAVSIPDSGPARRRGAR
jgi:hypothetical protein